MMFPKARISELEKDLQTKKETLLRDKDILVDSIREELNPINFLKKHIGMAFGGILTFLTTLFLIGKSRKSSGTKEAGAASDNGKFLKILAVAAPLLIEKLLPLAIKGGEEVIRNVTRKSKGGKSAR
ncbi:MAG: hypothetical protein LHV69_06070 [Elusimicrobia bacterium]|nr:hypothetical protein [Candidatus Obscuribacterium magneticum]